MAQAVLLFDSRCGFCRRWLSRFLRWDQAGRLRPVALQERKLASWHLVGADGRVYSAGAAFPPLLRLLPGGRPLAWLSGAFPSLTDGAYRHVARTRGPRAG